MLVCQTGLIGIPMPMDPVESGVPQLTQQLSSDLAGGTAAADAILTSDTRPKTVTVSFTYDGKKHFIAGIAKVREAL